MEEPKTIEELERKIRQLSNPVEQDANKMAREVVRALILFLNGNGKLPERLVLSIGMKLMQHVASGEQIAQDIQRLYDLLEEASPNVSNEDTVESVDV